MSEAANRNYRKRRYNERWVDCAAAEAVYEQTKAQQRKFKIVTELGQGLLSRIRGRGKKDIVRPTVLMQITNIEKFADRCGVDVNTILANGDGLNPHREPVTCDVGQTQADQKGNSNQDSNDYKLELKQLVYELENHHTNPEGIFWIGQTLIRLRSKLRRNNILGRALELANELLDDIENDTRSQEGAFDVFISPKKVSCLIDEIEVLLQAN